MKSPDRLTVPGKLTVMLGHGTDGIDRFRIEVEDARSHTTFLTLTISPEELACALGGRGFRPCSLELNGLDRLGLVFEHKVEHLPAFPISGFSADTAARQAALDAHVAPWEVDGWIASTTDLLNSHNAGKGNLWRVGFSRWVPTPSTPPLPFSAPESFGGGNLCELAEPLPINRCSITRDGHQCLLSAGHEGIDHPTIADLRSEKP